MASKSWLSQLPVKCESNPESSLSKEIGKIKFIPL